MNYKKINIGIIILIYIFVSFLTPAARAENDEETVQEEQIAAEEQEDGEMTIYSESAILIESTTGKILYEKNIHDKKYPASTTKVLTAILAIENCDLEETATASENAINSLEDGYTKADIQIGETFTIQQLLDVMMIQSANEAAVIIAEHISGSVDEFAKLMNQKAKEIGCVDSNFVNPNGMHDENHYSSAYDLALIARYCMQNEKFRELANKMECSLPWTEYWGEEQVEEHGERTFKNTNNLLNTESKYYYQYAIGIKAGFTTPAKNCLIAASNKDGYELISVILHAENTEDGSSARYVDTINLFEYGYNNYNLEDILNEYSVETSVEDVSNLANTTTNNDQLQTNSVEETTNQENDEKEFEEETFFIENIEIIIGICMLFVAIIIFFILHHRKKGRHEKNIYKFKI